MNTPPKGLALTVATWLLLGALLITVHACSVLGENTGTCTTTCFSRSTGNNLGSVTYENYTRSECEQALENRETTLTTCTMEFD